MTPEDLTQCKACYDDLTRKITELGQALDGAQITLGVLKAALINERAARLYGEDDGCIPFDVLAEQRTRAWLKMAEVELKAEGLL